MSDNKDSRFLLRLLISLSVFTCVILAYSWPQAVAAMVFTFLTITYIDTLCAAVSRERSLRLALIEQAIRESAK